ncbi:tannase/feruloyl esterase family alpha/beta hydrolase [Acinetobacter nosocomialis]|uniref:tannase/feruloyl esterase family alpha/beta hydrolase n=1 Tax=Acinetobacter calcoaceticus/baumannii complex TaxID=909768 RepID=UPI00228F4142|nr:MULTISPECIES: tannase/feruloyl esterase family alpha/beta hydrolase [Acinetobacter calcoaceticus/baumannii complex]MDO7509516.1 tannase/feruloyl esterase family alpha/beta hydrolase [Acinetobacter baumannii]MDO7192448.1 tannase/feruloyl esterase family alpha/beta hydrolase [Acinetobacter nosocomialis]MDV7627554.1 tannase/feruloyl esterase family alpha/beta hydrolase [Acinetobacter baumannii]MDV7646115.1 tannase/feruloyl esterase family alpha/beta hydrolase [Acinetobacter baumannii]MDV765299
MKEFSCSKKIFSKKLYIGMTVIAGSLLQIGCGDKENDSIKNNLLVVNNPETKCSNLEKINIASNFFELSTNGAIITSVSLIKEDKENNLPEFCKVQGSIKAVNSSDPDIQFQVNLPIQWNYKAVQLGGGGFNGQLVTGTKGAYSGISNWPANTKVPLAMNYVTFGSDGGTTSDGKFGLNAQALANYSGESVKRTHDAAIFLIKTFYDASPHRMYHLGGSKGGHESLVAAQRYGKDYDGVIAYYPANQNQAMVLSWYRMWLSAYGNDGKGALTKDKQELLQSNVLNVCDALDGIKDGIVSNKSACESKFNINDFRCKNEENSTDNCFTSAQIETLTTAATPLQLPFTLANGVQNIGPYPIFLGGGVTGILFDSNGLDGRNTSYYYFIEPVVKYFIKQDPNATLNEFNYLDWKSRIEYLSNLLDATNPNLDEFQSRGGKLLLIQGSTDMLVAPEITSNYYKEVSKRYGANTRNFFRYYFQPGFGHGGGAFALQWDSLSFLDQWVETGNAQENPVVIDGNPNNEARARPLCEYPQFAKYKGQGNINNAENFNCVDK